MRKYSPVTDRRRLRFTPRLIPTLATVAAIAAFALLGRWQLDRADEKRALTAAFAATGPAVELPDDSGSLPRYQRVIARGRYDTRRQFLLDNRLHEGRTGVQVLTPLVLDGGGMVLVNRGWQPFGRTRQDLPDVAVPEGPRRIAGKIDELPRAGIKLSATSSGGWPRLVNYPTMKDLEDLSGGRFHARVILLDAAEPDGYLRDWRLHGALPDRNLGYAIQWFAFAATAAAIWIALSLRRTGENAE